MTTLASRGARVFYFRGIHHVGLNREVGMPDPRIVWPAVTGGYLIAFGVFEAAAIKHGTGEGKPSGTYTAWWRRILGLEPERWWRPVGVVGFLGFFAWLIPHILLGIWNA